MSAPTCRIVRGGVDIFTSYDRGISPLVAVIDGGLDVKGAVAYDKVVGRAAALLYAVMGIGEVRAELMSAAAARALESAGIPYSAERRVERIINRSGTGPCPMEDAVMDIDDPAAALAVLKKKLVELNS